MGDFIALLEHLNLSPLNSLVLGAVAWYVKGLIKRIESLEADRVKSIDWRELKDETEQYGRDLAVIKKQLEID